ncbi:tripartite tricarboxylate transporter TctB family protein [Algihabitans albus]|uniref:tripartite tricarboxylate transporter TctB family protein n=1 Tax=Algihabitans albus TaxID=2164067 RepID=UPI000E5C8549|nr:tripartite tricarboxylate transporter TctB family protein [Algihabitans albus]
MRVAELMVAALLMGLSGYFMLHATALPIGWEPGAGPGGGAFPFWLSLIMLAAVGGVFLRQFAGLLADRGSSRPFVTRAALRDLLFVGLSLVATIALIHVVGAYVAIPLFLLFYLRVMGNRGWRLTATLALVTPVVVFFFFEVALKILLPKGITEPLFIPLYTLLF